MKANEKLIGEAVRWLDSFSFIGSVFPIKTKENVLGNSNIESVVMCNTKEVSKEIQKVSYEEFLAYDKSMLIIQFGTDEHKLISKDGAAVISDRILLNLTFCESLDDTNFIQVMNTYLGLDYKDVFCNSISSDFVRFISCKGLLYQCLRMINEVLDIIYEQGLTYDLMLETKVYPIYQEIFRKGFLIDIDGMKNEYKMVENENRVMSGYFLDKYSLSPESDDLRGYLDFEGLQILYRYQKNQRLLRNYPINNLIKRKNGKVYPFITSSYKQIGTKTLRVSTSRVNIYGLPKRLQKHLIPNVGNIFVEADFHASQLLIIAQLAQEKWLIDAYEKGNDIYVMLACSFFGKEIKEIEPNERKAVKKLFFAYINGARINSLNEILNNCGVVMTVKQLKKSMQWLEQSIPNVVKYRSALKYKTNVKTPSGRWWSEDTIPEHRKRAAYIIQIIEAEILFNAVLMIQEAISSFVGMKIYITKHDSITIEAPVEYVNDAKNILRDKMAKAVQVFFEITDVHTNVIVTPFIKEKEKKNMNNNNKKLNEINIATLKSLRGQMKYKKRKPINITKPVPEVEYVALITDSNYDEDNNIVKVNFTVFINQSTFPYIATFNLSSNALYYYEKMLELVGDEEENIIGKLCHVVFHQNQSFMNIEVLGEATEEELGIDMDDVDEEVTSSKPQKSSRTVDIKRRQEILEEDDEEDIVEFEDEEVDN